MPRDEDDDTVPCPHCGADVYEDAEQCPACGQYISAEDRPAGRPAKWVMVVMVLALIAVLMMTFG